MKKVVTILGARPQFIKAGSVSREFKKHTNIRELIVHTGQHYDSNMSDIFFDEMKIPKPDFFLDVSGLSHGAMVGQMIEKIELVLLSEKPDWILVYGDTNSTLAGAIAASKLGIKIAHVEAGLRSFNMNMPEEVNRIITDRISTLLFCPTQTAINNLNAEGINKWDAKVYLSGDVMRDGALFYKELAEPISNLIIDGEFALVTIHRAENTDSPTRLGGIIDAINEISESMAVVLPLHPRTKAKLRALSLELSSAIKVIEPVGYLNMIWLIRNCNLVMTDSGGLQKEAFFFEKPCITLRDETEWVELVDNNFNVLVGADKQAIISAFKEHVFSKHFNTDLYGDSSASDTVVRALINYEK